ncbi:MAG: response regulator [Polyangiaceae bacterium]|nr:response regulator [Polyangiaceae bacterium]
MADPRPPLAPTVKNLRVLGWALVVTYAVMLVVHGLDLQRAGARAGLIASSITIVLLLAALGITRVRPPSPQGANHLAGAFSLVVLANIAVHYTLARDPSTVAMFVFYLLGVSGLLFHRGWVIASLILGYGAWMLATVLTPHANALRDGLTLVTTAGIGFVVYLGRMRAMAREAELRERAETRQQLAEERTAALNELQTSLAGIVERNPDGMLVHKNGRVLFANHRLADMLRFESSDELVGLELSDLLGSTSGGVPGGLSEVRVRRRDGEAVVLEVASTAIQWEREHAMLLAARDATARHAALEERLLQSDRLLTVGRLAAGVAHEINNPLSYVLGNLAEIEREELRPEARELLREASEGARRVSSIARNLESFVHPDASDPKDQVDVVELLESCVRMVEHELPANTVIERQFPSRPQLLTDEHRLGQVFVNLLLNASQAMDNASQRLLSLSVEEREEAVVVSVKDTGVGMPLRVRRRLFEPFFTTKPVGKGTGLGLHYCYNTVRGLGGSIDVSTEVGVGSTFTVHLPTSIERTASTSLLPLRIVVIDDDRAVARSVARMLRGHDVTIAESAVHGVELMESGQFDVAVCDLMMPGMDGIEVHQRLVTAGLAERVVFVTGGVFSETAQRRIDAIENPVLRKPLDATALSDAIRQVTEARNNRGISGTRIAHPREPRKKHGS